MTAYTARWVFPVAGRPIPGGSVVVDGDRIVEVTHKSIGEDLGDVALIPGLVNAHTHLDLSGARGRIPPTTPETFTDWLLAVIAFRRGRSAEQVRADYAAGLAECLRFGTTLVGDIVATPECLGMLEASPIRGVAFRELIGLDSGRFKQLIEEVEKTNSLSPASGEREFVAGTVARSVSLHAPYSVTGDRELLGLAGAAAGPVVAIHVAESPGELELLAHRTGPFVEFLSKLGVYRPDALANSIDEFLARISPSGVPRQLLVHANYLPADFARAPHQWAVICPRTHAAFGHPPHPLLTGNRQPFACLGTDSLASNPDLDILAEAVELWRRYPLQARPYLPLLMITARPARWLGFDDCGALGPGMRADMVAVPIGPNVQQHDSYTAYGALYDADLSLPRRVMAGGVWVV